MNIFKFACLGLLLAPFHFIQADLLPNHFGGDDIRNPPVQPPGRVSALSIPAVQSHTVRVAYVVPNNRTAQPDAAYKLQTTVLAYQWWFRDQMERNGFGPKTFRFETEEDGLTPKIHIVNVNVSDAVLREDLWGRTIDAAVAAGVPVWTPRQIWWLVSEAHLLNSDGSLIGGTALGGSFGSGDDAGVGTIGGDGLARMKPLYLHDNRNYAGITLPEIGPYRMAQDKTFPWFEGSTISSVSSSILGAGLHELSHAFGLPHNMRNDDNMHGNLMGNGLRGWRGALYPDRYPSDYVRLSYGSALFLNYSRYFNAGQNFTDQGKPVVTFQTPDAIQTTNGTAHIQFRATDAGGLAAAWLVWKGELIDEMKLTGTVATHRFETSFYTPGQAAEYKVIVIDRQGNRGEAMRNVKVAQNGNAAPQPKIKVTPTYPTVGQTVTFDATASSDPDGSATTLQSEWDFDGDGTFDTVPSATKRTSKTFTEPGVYLARARLRDAAGAVVLSAPIGFRVLPPESKSQSVAVEETGQGLQYSWKLSPFGFRLQSSQRLGPDAAWSNITPAPTVWGISNIVTLPKGPDAEFFRLIK
ncbi:MAG: PKD domain-containing protein [Verrucomicrobiales bacterium]